VTVFLREEQVSLTKNDQDGQQQAIGWLSRAYQRKWTATEKQLGKS
jgi:hypothetical protein